MSTELQLPERRHSVVHAVGRGAVAAADNPGAAASRPTPPAEGAAPLTSEQRDRWLACRFDPADAPSRIERWVVDITGPVRRDALDTAVRAVRERFDALRTVYLSDGSGQRVCPIGGAAHPGLEDYPGARQGGPAGPTVSDDQAKGLFDPEHGPLAHFWWISQPEGGRLIFATHPLVSDAQSARTILGALAASYNAAVDRGSQEIPGGGATEPLAAAAWMELGGAHTPEALVSTEYWRRRLAAPPEPLDLPLDRPRPATPGYRGGTVRLEVGGGVADAVRTRVQNAGVTLEDFLISAWAALIHRLSGSEGFLLGVGIDGDPARVGPFERFRPIKPCFGPGITFQDLVRETARERRDAIRHSNADVAAIVRDLRLPRDAARPWLGGVTVAMRPSLDDLAFHGIAATGAFERAEHLEGDLALTIHERSHGFLFEVCFNLDVFESATIQRWLGHYVTLIDSAVRAPESAVDRLELLTPDERMEIIRDWNPAPMPRIDGPALLHRHFAASVVRRPDHPAVVFEGKETSYAVLEARANRLAHHLVAHGAGPDRCVALLLDRSLDYATAALAVLKAGAAFVPIDPEWPAERQELVVRDCAAVAVITGGRPVPERMPAATRIVDLRTVGDRIAQLPETAPAVELAPENLAYLIYTSGSTGRPKGVMIEHRAAATHMASIARVYRMASDDRSLLFHSVAFDPAIEQLFAPWVVGATVYVRGGRLWTGREFSEWVRRERITAVTLPPLYWLQLLRDWEQVPALAPVGHLRRVLVGGEALPQAVVDLWRRLGLTSIRLLNGYGPTECTVTATVHDLPAEPSVNEACGRIPIGRPQGPVEAYVLDDSLQPRPIGVAGELCLAGPTVARGYLGRQALTDERFVPHPFRSGARMYRTGDQARMLADGTIDFCGRADRQVKVGGYRVEPGEIEAVLGRLKDVSACAVVVEKDARGESVLIGYVVLTQDARVTEASLRAELSVTLPRYMVPARLVDVPELPRTINGKLDLAALASLGAAAQARDSAAHALREQGRKQSVGQDELEGRISAIWSAVLGRPQASPADDFFMSGGHSLLAVDLYSRIEREFNVRLALSDWLADASLAALTRLVRARLAGARPAPDATARRFLFPINDHGTQPSLFLFAGGRGCDEDFVVLAGLTRALGGDQPVWGVRVGGPDRLRATHPTTEAIAVDVAREIRALQPLGPYHLAGECIGGLLAYEVARLFEREGARVAFLGLINTGCPRVAESFRWWVSTSWIGRAKQTVKPLFNALRRSPWREAPGHLFQAFARVLRPPHSGRAARGDGMPENPKDYFYGRLLLRYRPSRTRVPLSLFGCETYKRATNLRRWSRHAEAGVRLVPLAGDTTTCIREYAADSAARLRAALGETATQATPIDRG